MAVCIEAIKAREILDSRGNPTVEVDVRAGGRRGRPGRRALGRLHRRARGGRAARRRQEALPAARASSRPSRTSTTRSPRQSSAWTPPTRRRSTSAMIELDGTPNKAKLGANAILGVSLAVGQGRGRGLPACRSTATSAGANAHVLPVPMMNILNGGKHADNNVDFQEFMVQPWGATSFREGPADGRRDLPRPQEGAARTRATTPPSATRAASPRTSRATTRPSRSSRGHREGRLQARRGRLHRPRPGRQRAVRRGQEGQEATSFFKSDPDRIVTSDEMVDIWAELVQQVPDPLASRTAWPRTTGTAGRSSPRKLGDKVQLVGDDLFVTNVKRLARGIDEKARQQHPGQGQPDRHADRDVRRRSTWPCATATRPCVSHRRGETEDTTIADIAVATNAGQIKTGSASRTDRVAKYNQLLRIEEQLGDKAAVYGAKFWRKP